MSESRRWIFALVGAMLVAGFPSRAVYSDGHKNKLPPWKPHSLERKLIRRPYSIAHLIDARTASDSADNISKVSTLMNAIVCSVKPKSWHENGGSATIEYHADHKVLVVEQTIEGHRRIGCVLEALTYIRGKEQRSVAARPKGKEPAELKRLAGKKGKKEVKVVLWTYLSLDLSKELIQADSRLAVMLAEEIRRLSEENGEKVTIVKPNLVEQYKSRHPDWQALDVTRVGHDFNADYVINLEIDKLGLYEPNANQSLYRGHTEILVSVVDMKNPDDVQHKEFNDRYPAETGNLTPFDVSPSMFRDQFLAHVAKQLAFYFVDHKRGTRKALMDE